MSLDDPIDKQVAFQDQPDYLIQIKNSICDFCQKNLAEFDVEGWNKITNPICNECRLLRLKDFPYRPPAIPRSFRKKYWYYFKCWVKTFPKRVLNYLKDIIELILIVSVLGLLEVGEYIWKVLLLIGNGLKDWVKSDPLIKDRQYRQDLLNMMAYIIPILILITFMIVKNPR